MSTVDVYSRYCELVSVDIASTVDIALQNSVRHQHNHASTSNGQQKT
ncbi:MAG: hypothetical protein AAFQ40_05835 [Cyanobacteria bacterium J06623_5]